MEGILLNIFLFDPLFLKSTRKRRVKQLMSMAAVAGHRVTGKYTSTLWKIGDYGGIEYERP